MDEVRDATRRTRLANERTFLAWWRSGLTAFAVAIGAGKLVPAIADGVEPWPYELLGAGFALLGVAFVGYGWARQRAVDRALAAGGYAAPRRPRWPASRPRGWRSASASSWSSSLPATERSVGVLP